MTTQRARRKSLLVDSGFGDEPQVLSGARTRLQARAFFLRSRLPGRKGVSGMIAKVTHPEIPKGSQSASPEASQAENIGRTHSKKWRKDRFEVWLRDDFRCQYCDADLLASYQGIMMLTVDHVIPFRLSQDNSPDNLVTCCSPCNALKGGYPCESLEGAREMVASLRTKAMANFMAHARTFGVQFPRHTPEPVQEVAAAFQAANQLIAFVEVSKALRKKLHGMEKRLDTVGEAVDVLSYFRSLFYGVREIAEATGGRPR